MQESEARVTRPEGPVATSDDERKALIDMDSSVAAYADKMREEQDVLRWPGEPPYEDALSHDDEPPYIQARRKLIQRQPGFWKGLKRIELGFDVVEMMRAIGFGLHVVTKGPRGTSSAWSEKLEWCIDEIPDAIVTVTTDKSAVYGRAFLEDWPPYFESWLKARKNGAVVCVAQPWNLDYAVGGKLEHPNVLRYDGTNKDRVQQFLRRAYERKGGESLWEAA